MESTLQMTLGVSNGVKSENIGIPTDFVNNLIESCDTDAIEFF